MNKQLTKEEIHSKQLKNFRKSGDATDAAMDEYAQQEAITFAEWMFVDDWYYNKENKAWRKLDNAHEYKTTEQLYQLYKQKRK